MPRNRSDSEIVRPASAGLEPTGLVRLWAAALLDAILGFGLWALCAEALLLTSDFSGSPLTLPAAVYPSLLVLAFGLHVIYHVLCIGRFGQTLGKNAMGIAIVKRDGSAAGYLRAFLRSAGGLVSVLTLGLANLGVIVTRERRGLGDWLAGTQIVRFSGSRGSGSRRTGGPGDRQVPRSRTV